MEQVKTQTTQYSNVHRSSQGVRTIKEKSVSISIPKVNLKIGALSRYEITVICVAVALAVCIIIATLNAQVHNREIQRATRNYISQTTAMKQQTATMQDEIAQQHHYETIKQTAEANGMTINQSNVKVVDDEESQ